MLKKLWNFSVSTFPIGVYRFVIHCGIIMLHKSTLTCIFYEHFFCLQITDVDNVSNHLESIIDASVSFRTEVRNVALSLKKSESKVRRFVASNFSFKFDEQI